MTRRCHYTTKPVDPRTARVVGAPGPGYPYTIHDEVTGWWYRSPDYRKVTLEPRRFKTRAAAERAIRTEARRIERADTKAFVRAAYEADVKAEMGE